MDAEGLRALQAPLKARYKEDPGTALVTLRSRGKVSQQTVTCDLLGDAPRGVAGLHPAAGGDGSAGCSANLLLDALVGCAGVTLAAVSTAMGLDLGDSHVSAEGDLDFRGTLGVARDAPVGFAAIRVTFELGGSIPEDKAKKLVELVERYCVVFQTLAKPPAIAVVSRTA